MDLDSILRTQAVVDAGALPLMYSLLHHPKPNIKKESCWMISNVTAGNATQINEVVKAGLLKPLVEVMAKVGGSSGFNPPSSFLGSRSCVNQCDR